MIEARFLSVLRQIVLRLADSAATWAITGSLGLALQGIDVAVHDIDLQTDRTGALEFERRFADSVIRPVVFSPSERVRSYLGAIQIEEVTIEIIGDMQKRLGSSPWEDPVRVQEHLVWLEREGMRIPVMSLEHELEAYLQMGRRAKAQMIRDYLMAHGSVARHPDRTPFSGGPDK